MVTTKLSRTEPYSRSGPVNHARPSRLDPRTSERAPRHGTGYTNPANPMPHDPSSFIDGRPKTAAEKQREKRLLDDPLADLLGPLFVGCKRCGTRIKLSPKSSYDPFHWVKHRERCLRRSIEAVREILREKEDRTRSFDAESPQQDGGDAIVDAQFSASPRLPSPSSSSAPSLSSQPSLQRRSETDSITPPLVVDEDEVDRLSHPSHSDQREVSPSQYESGVSSERDGSPCGGGEAPPPLCALSVFRTPDMLAFEDYLHRSRRLPTRLGFPDLLPSPEKWHDWSWGRLRAPVYVVPKRPEVTAAVACVVRPPHPSHEDSSDGILQPQAHNASDPLSDTP